VAVSQSRTATDAHGQRLGAAAVLDLGHEDLAGEAGELRCPQVRDPRPGQPRRIAEPSGQDVAAAPGSRGAGTGMMHSFVPR